MPRNKRKQLFMQKSGSGYCKQQMPTTKPKEIEWDICTEDVVLIRVMQ